MEDKVRCYEGEGPNSTTEPLTGVRKRLLESNYQSSKKVGKNYSKKTWDTGLA